MPTDVIKTAFDKVTAIYAFNTRHQCAKPDQMQKKLDYWF